ncbi:TldD/PmbA family protein [Roseovarius sp. SCSIO 43702]|uniref:TldD/PmbA family protein n=1 Tax=Roseovarius sp. SCSIO 43702 TaxID=2823043 RepID=UPI001C72DF52|nr:TldD/PmbA family protein [Roseovarius sp. SCSIO 43702]QYX57541.1 TldD/PmbA family protein [Roseovarius sp. SCSIO 43702]
MTETPQALTEALIDAAQKAGADAADAMASRGTSITVDVRNRALEQAERAESVDIGLRVFLGRRQATVSASDIRDATVRALAERAVAMAREAPEDPYAGLAGADEVAREWDVAALDLEDRGPEPAPDALEEAARRAEAAARDVAGVTQVQSATAAYGRDVVHLATSNGFSGGYARTDHVVSCVAIAGSGSGMERDHDSDGRIHREDMRSPESIGRRAGERAAEREGARKPPTGAYPVLFDERVARSLIGHLLAAANGAAIARGSSWLLNKLGEPVLPEALSLVEDPHRPRVMGSRAFDGEGLATKRRTIVEDGRLLGWTLDLATARQLGMRSTANAQRSTSGTPRPGIWNVALTQGDASRDDLIREMGEGLLVTSMIGSTINPNTGDYSRGVAGFWVEGGEIAYPVNEGTIAGSLPDFLRRVTPANDARTHLSHVVPSLLVEGLTLAGV